MRLSSLRDDPQEYMARRQPEMSEVLQLAKQLLAALDYAHSKGVCHNFLNPYNIKVLPDGTLKLLDFGLLRDKNLLTQSPTKKLENEPYLCPEQERTSRWTRQEIFLTRPRDLSALHGAQSVPRTAPGEVDRSITDVDPHPMQMAHPRVPEAISKVVLKALAKNPAARYSSGQQFFDALEEAAKAAGFPRQQRRVDSCVSGWPGTERQPGDKTHAGPQRSQSFKAMPGTMPARVLGPFLRIGEPGV